MDDSGVADAFYTVLSIGIVLVAAIAVSGVVLSTTTRQSGDAAAQIAGYGDGGLKKGLYCFYFAADSAQSNITSGDPDAIVLQKLSLESTGDRIALNSTSAPANTPASLGMALWSGYLYVPETGSYTFELKSAGQAWLWVDGNIVAGNRQSGTLQSKTFALSLAKGNHPVKVKYFYPEIRMASCSLNWKQGGGFVPVRSFNR
jgi:PA14 domain